MRTGDIFVKKHGEGVFFSSLRKNFIIVDNLDPNSSMMIRERKEIYNGQYTYVTIVLSGKLKIKLNGNEIEVNANEYLVVMPCVKVEILESKCRFVGFLTKSYIVNDVYHNVGVAYSALSNCFCFHHHKFNPKQIETLYKCYLIMKREHLREDYYMKEFTMRALLAIYLTNLHSFLSDHEEISHFKNTRQRILFNKFLKELSDNYTEERSVQFYAQKLGITSKYLSTITSVYTGEPASAAIDKFVVFRIQQLLYSGEMNIKTISEKLHFPTQSFFGRYYKRVTGVSPRDYVRYYNKKANL